MLVPKIIKISPSFSKLQFAKFGAYFRHRHSVVVVVVVVTDKWETAGDYHGDDERLEVSMFDQWVGATAQIPEVTTDCALWDDVTAGTATLAEALRTAVVRVLDTLWTVLDILWTVLGTLRTAVVRVLDTLWTVLDTLRTAVIRVLDEDDTHLVHLLHRTAPTDNMNTDVLQRTTSLFSVYCKFIDIR